MISTSVNPCFIAVVFFIPYFTSPSGVNATKERVSIKTGRSHIALWKPH
jgi:hypothetical protein